MLESRQDPGAVPGASTIKTWNIILLGLKNYIRNTDC